MEFETLCQIIKEHVPNQNIDIKLESLLEDDLGLSSFDMMVIIVEIEEKTNKKVDILALKQENTVKGLLSAIK